MSIPSTSISNSVVSSIAGAPKASRQSAAAKNQQSESTRQARDETKTQAVADDNAIGQGDQSGQREADGRQLPRVREQAKSPACDPAEDEDVNTTPATGVDYHA
ncbi:MAG: hypothetical protein WBD20_11505 [Pirellulaceae bacterium]